MFSFGTCSAQENFQQTNWVLIPNACIIEYQQHEKIINHVTHTQ